MKRALLSLLRISPARVAAVMIKEFTQLRRDRITYAMILVMPLMQLLLFGYAINTDPRHLPAAVISYDHGRLADAVVATLERSTYVDVKHLPTSEAEMDRLMRRGEISLALTIPADFSERVLKGDRAQVLAEVDATDPTAAGGVSAAVAALPTEALRQDLRGAAARPPASAPFEVVIHRLYNPEGITSYNIVPGLLAIILSMTLVMMSDEQLALDLGFKAGDMARNGRLSQAQLLRSLAYGTLPIDFDETAEMEDRHDKS